MTAVAVGLMWACLIVAAVILIGFITLITIEALIKVGEITYRRARKLQVKLMIAARSKS